MSGRVSRWPRLVWSFFRICAFLIFLAAPGAALSAVQAPPRHGAGDAGVVVESAVTDGAAAKTGLKEGDVILSWVRPPSPPANPLEAAGEIHDPFDWEFVKAEQAPRGTVRLFGSRQGVRLNLELPPGPWGVAVRPWMEKETLSKYSAGKELLEKKDAERGLALWHEAADEAARAKRWSLSCWLFSKVAEAWGGEKQWDKAQEAYEKALGMAEDRERFYARIKIEMALGRAFQARGEFSKAEESYREAARLAEERLGESLTLAASLHALGVLAWNQGDLAGAEGYWKRALAVREKLEPQTQDVATSLNNLGAAAGARGDLGAAEAYLERSLAILEILYPESSIVADAIYNLGMLAKERGDLEAAEKYYKRSLAIYENMAPESLDVAMSLNNLGSVEMERRALDAAEVYYGRSLAIRQKLAPSSLEVADSLNNLGTLADEREDLGTAEGYYKRALALHEKLAPESLVCAAILNNLGALEKHRGNLDGAKSYFDRALSIKEKHAPDSLDVATGVHNLGLNALESGELEAAEAYLKRALEIRKRLSPASLDEAESLTGLGDLAARRNDLIAAESYWSRSLALWSKLAPGSASEATALNALGTIYSQRNLLDKALDFHLRAVSALEAQKGRLGGGNEASERFSARYADFYRDLIALQVRLKKADTAFGTLERFRARSLLDMLAERDLDFAKDAPKELLQEQKRTDFEYDKIQGQLAEISAEKEPRRAEELLAQLTELRERQREIGEKIKKASSRLAALQYPEPLGLEGTRRVLHPSTLFLSYCTAGKTTYLFALLGSEFEVFTLPVGRDDLTKRIRQYRALLAHPSTPESQLATSGQRLYEILLKPAEGLVRKSKRLLICPDGPLHVLPFAALRMDKKSHLIEKRPLSYTLSATLLKETLETERPEKHYPFEVAAFGDPVYPSRERGQGGGWERPSDTRFPELAPLPATREEVQGIAALYGKKAKVFLGSAATEEAACALGEDYRYVHFACHGLLDERFPLNSGLVLSMPDSLTEGRENGILQAWEVFERLRISAGLVTLSACQTGLGQEMGGEGLIGLTRAFQYAGARSVLSSLWSVSDRSTAELMRRFYGQLQEGKTPSEALRQAQVDLLRGKAGASFTHPFYWAGFALNGD